MLPCTQRTREAYGRRGNGAAVKAAYLELVAVVNTVSARTLRPPHAAHTDRLAALQLRMTHAGRPVPGLTAHQAKGGEWDIVGVSLRENERRALSAGLTVTEDLHRKIYVAMTRARCRTIEVFPATPLPKKRAARETTSL